MLTTLTLYRCMRRGFCKPLGGQSVWAARRPLDESPPRNDSSSSNSNDAPSSPRPTVLVSVPLDSNALFQDEAVGAQSTCVCALSYASRALIDCLSFSISLLPPLSLSPFFRSCSFCR